MEKKENIFHGDLFNNPNVKAQYATLTPDQKEKYKRRGEEMYKDVDFNTSKSISNMPPPMILALDYVLESIKSGQHISTLEENEQMLLEDAYGKKWYSVLGYTKEDVDDIVTMGKDFTLRHKYKDEK